MPLKPCRTCGKPVADDARACPHCGARLPVTSAVAENVGIGVLILVLIAALWFLGSAGQP